MAAARRRAGLSHSVHGNITGLKAQSLRGLERLYRRRVPRESPTTHELNTQLAALSAETGRQIAVLLTRRGEVRFVVVGDAHRIELPEIGRERGGHGRLRGLRLVHTHLQGEPLTRDDLTDLALLRFDLVAAVEVRGTEPGRWFAAHLDPRAPAGHPEPWCVLPPREAHLAAADTDFERFIEELEGAHVGNLLHKVDDRPRAVLVQVSIPSGPDPESSLAELRELARTAGVNVVDAVRQRRPALDPRTAIGRGKVDDLTVRAMQLGAELAIFDLDLSPAQARGVAEATDLKVLDRTQLILDIFAQRAQSREGKLQVELAQLKYRLPRLSQEGSRAFTRLMGGIGGRGPGEQKLEIDRRRVKDRIVLLSRELESVAKDRQLRRSRRNRNELPVVSIVGYTNAGKSTLLNALTRSEVVARDQLFATLDPTSRRLRIPSEREVIITDTVGFIRDLPPDLVRAFQATLEELADADVLLHVIDASSPHATEQIEAVEGILRALGLADRPVVRVLNKADRVEKEAPQLAALHEGIAVSALAPETLGPLLAAIDARIGAAPTRSAPSPSAEQAGWLDRWARLDTPWDLGGPHPAVFEFTVAAGPPGVPPGAEHPGHSETETTVASAVVPGCGRGWDALALHERGFGVVALDLAADAGVDLGPLCENGGRFVAGDVFAMSLPEAPFDLWWDHTFFCALPPHRRREWGRRAAEWVRPGGCLVAVVFPNAAALPEAHKAPDGPPFPFRVEDLEAALGDAFRLVSEVACSEPELRRGRGTRLATFARVP